MGIILPARIFQEEGLVGVIFSDGTRSSLVSTMEELINLIDEAIKKERMTTCEADALVPNILALDIPSCKEHAEFRDKVKRLAQSMSQMSRASKYN